MRYYVYVISLEPEVGKIARFRERNPDMDPGAECYYVGQSIHEPDCRYRQHKECHGPVIKFSCICERPKGDFSKNLGNRYARKFGTHLQRSLFEKYNPLPTRAEAERVEKMLAIQLQLKGCGVWWG